MQWVAFRLVFGFMELAASFVHFVEIAVGQGMDWATHGWFFGHTEWGGGRWRMVGRVQSSYLFGSRPRAR